MFWCGTFNVHHHARMNSTNLSDILLFTLAGAAVGGILIKNFQNKKQLKNDRIGNPHPCSASSKYKGCVYLDYNATTPIFEEVADVMTPFLFSFFGNPSSPHVYAAPCKNALDAAREHLKNLINAENSSCIILTSCGSESDNRAIDIGLHNFTSNSIPHVVTSTIEHPAILEYLKHLVETKKIELTVIGVDSNGIINPNDVFAALQSNTALVTIMHSNNEVGTLQPIRRIAELISKFNGDNRLAPQSPVLLHSDGAQTMGKVLVDVQAEGVDLFTVVGHKFGAPKGVAALYVRQGLKVRPLFFGGGQEGGRRAGTENILLAVGLGEASRIALSEAKQMLVHLLRLRARFIAGMASQCASRFGASSSNLIRYNGPAEAYQLSFINETLLVAERDVVNPASGESVSFPVLPNTISVSFKGVRASQLMPLLLDKVACSSGTTCHSCHSADALSAVLAAMNVPLEYGTGTLRISFGRHSTNADIDLAVSAILEAVESLF